MFYSQTYLARKGPLATVWIAAHLQHRLKKSHYTSTDISSTVDRIMSPEVPIALRMSGHLLLGVVRIYSKKVDYLFQDCNVVLSGLSKAFASIQLTLPEDAMQAPFHSITLPDTFDLDALNLDDELDHDGFDDSHLRSQEEITLADPYPAGMNHYIAISFDEDIMMGSSHTEVQPDSEGRPMEEDILPHSPVTNVVDPGPSIQRESPIAQHTDDHQPSHFQDSETTRHLGSQDVGPGNQTDVLNFGPTENNASQTIPEIEVLRDANHNFNSENPLPSYPEIGDNSTESNIFVDQAMNEKDHVTPMIDDLIVEVEGQSVPSEQHSGSPRVDVSPRNSEAQLSVGHNSPNLVLCPSPPMQQPQRRTRKRKQFFDTTTVLSNKFMKKALNDTSDMLRSRRVVPSSLLGTWKVNNSQRKDQIFYQPLVSGLCKDLLDITEKEIIYTKPHLVVTEEDHTDAGIARTPSPSNQIPEEPGTDMHPSTVSANDMEIERLRSVAASPLPSIPANNVEVELNIENDRISPIRGDDLTPASAQNLRSVSVSPLRENGVSGTIQTPDLAASCGVPGPEMETPVMCLNDRTFQENFGLSDTHRLINSAEAEDLYFLEADNNTPTSSQGSEGVNSLSVRTRAVAQYLKKHSPISPTSEDLAGDLSLNRILEGKTRKLSARMFYETLVLKSLGLIDLQQEEPYGDVNLKLTPTLSKAQL